MKQKQTVGVLMLMLTAFIWGIAFVAQSAGMDYVGPFTFNATRSILGGVVLIPCILLLDKLAGRKPSLWGTQDKTARRTLVKGGVACGLVLAVASSLQQFGIRYTTVGKAGFITALYILIVPLLSLLLGKRPGWLVWVGVGVAVVGMYLLCMTEGFSLSFGDTLVLLCAVCFSLHILIVDRFSPLVDGVRLSCIQFLVCGIVTAVPMFLFEHPTWQAIAGAWLPIGFAGIFSCGVAYTLQVLGQQRVQPVLASLLMSFESVFSVLAGWVLLGQKLSARELFGCALMFCAIVLAQLPQPARGEKTAREHS